MILATSGEAGRIADASLATRETLASVREAEDLASWRALGLEPDVRFLRHPDGGLEEGPRDALVDELRELLEAVTPEVVVTFGAEGITGHADHVAIGRAATEAFGAPADIRERWGLLAAAVRRDRGERARSAERAAARARARTRWTPTQPFMPRGVPDDRDRGARRLSRPRTSASSRRPVPQDPGRAGGRPVRPVARDARDRGVRGGVARTDERATRCSPTSSRACPPRKLAPWTSRSERSPRASSMPFFRASEAASSSVAPTRPISSANGDRRAGPVLRRVRRLRHRRHRGRLTMPMTIPGGQTVVGFVTAVGVRPTHRRRGINGELMRRQLDDARNAVSSSPSCTRPRAGSTAGSATGLGRSGSRSEVGTARSAFVRGYAPAGEMRLVERGDAMKEILSVNAATRLAPAGHGAARRATARRTSSATSTAPTRRSRRSSCSTRERRASTASSRTR